jgi:nuclear transport factor 2 (NTF2) superfamily protein
VEKPFGIREWQARNRRVSYTQIAKELHYRLIKELWTFTGNRFAGRFA